MKLNEPSISNTNNQSSSFGDPSGVSQDLICLSHLRWDFVYQRPQHLLSRFAAHRRVFFFEEPIYEDTLMHLDIGRRDDGVHVVTPRLPRNLAQSQDAEHVLRSMINQLFARCEIKDHILWYYTPMAVSWTSHLEPAAVIYDCMDELSAFKGAPAGLKAREVELFSRCDLVFTGGQSLFEVKKNCHPNVYAFPSSIDAQHFVKARTIQDDPIDQADIPHPRLGFSGVIDERMDLELLDGIALKRPDWHLVVIGPVAKIDKSDLPRRANIHYLGAKAYKDLPSYLAGWDVALLPFARNDSTRFISPTKTPEYLAAGKPVVSTSIQDVRHPYGQLDLVHIADTVDEFVAAAESAMKEDHAVRIRAIDAFLANKSWDHTWGRMNELINDVLNSRGDLIELEPVMKSFAAKAASGTSIGVNSVARD